VTPSREQAFNIALSARIISLARARRLHAPLHIDDYEDDLFAIHEILI